MLSLWRSGPYLTAESASSPHVHFAALLGERGDHRPTCPVMVNQMLWREAQTRLRREPRKRKQKNNEINKSCVNGAEPCPPSPGIVQALAGDSSGAESTPGDTEDPEPQPGPSEGDDVGPLEQPPLKGQYGTAQLQDPTLGNALRNVQVQRELWCEPGQLLHTLTLQ